MLALLWLLVGVLLIFALIIGLRLRLRTVPLLGDAAALGAILLVHGSPHSIMEVVLVSDVLVAKLGLERSLLFVDLRAEAPSSSLLMKLLVVKLRVADLFDHFFILFKF